MNRLKITIIQGVINALNCTISDDGNLNASNIVSNVFELSRDFKTGFMMAISVGQPSESIRTNSDISVPSNAINSRTNNSYGALVN
ncbi:hypothetical protein DERP_011415 [Dermatophagoides pteronyssinus]|uniref:Uncharacterized protein n=1 Tax=Dermatophagoides pteronyssinus TaxID=6956 RepID=A0ABQ8J552_DERPT|nr:hypothetical protein DERP_011415 [Dermatophagoides pteronyssinus]